MDVPILDLHPGTGRGEARSDFQRGLSPQVAFDEGYRGVIIKGGQGDGTYEPYHLREYFQRFAQVFKNLGLYFFLDATATGAEQAQYFVDQMELATGRRDGRGIALVIDYEGYSGEGWDLSPTNRILRNFVTELRKYIGRHKLGGYCNRSFWVEKRRAGKIADYDIDYVYDSRYPYSTVLEHPIRTMRETLPWYRNDPRASERWGGLEKGEDPAIWQASGASLVGNVVCDTNLLFVPFRELAA